MKSGDEIHELNYELIKRAVHGEPEALEEILRIYEPYHDSLVTSEVAGVDGKIYRVIDEDKKIQVQMHLVDYYQAWELPFSYLRATLFSI